MSLTHLQIFYIWELFYFGLICWCLSVLQYHTDAAPKEHKHKSYRSLLGRAGPGPLLKDGVSYVSYLCGFYGGLVDIGVACVRINAVGRVVLARVLRSRL